MTTTNHLSMATLRALARDGEITEAEVEKERKARAHEQYEIRMNEAQFGEHRNRHLISRSWSSAYQW